MTELHTQLDTSSDSFKANSQAMDALVAELREKTAEAAKGGNERAREKHLKRGKLLSRDRVQRLLDPGSPFLELSALAANGMYEGDVHGAGMITGIGR
ncbi:MAG TPA: methylcrotonoyl-CoA carboxylase, partial [Oceanicaulis sp.]|nr:methylcrotonoyl-CoA carboxylase [Oceanicaulis sp.]